MWGIIVDGLRQTFTPSVSEFDKVQEGAGSGRPRPLPRLPSWHLRKLEVIAAM